LISKEVNRRLTTILMLDVVGYSRLMAADENGTVAQVQAVRKELIIPKQEEYHGRTVKLMGDGALMEFGSVVDAVNFAIDIQRAIKRRNRDIPLNQQMRYRIGINIGDVIVDGEDVYGGGVNIAARLESICDTDGIYLTGDVFHQAENKVNVTFEPLGKKDLKNIPRPVTVYRVLLDAKKPERIADHNEAKPSRFLRLTLIIGITVAVSIAAALLARNWIPHDDSIEAHSVTTSTPPPIAALAKENPSVAVLPFANLSGDVEQEYFSDGITNDIITDLSQLSNLLVIASNSVFVYKNTPIKVQQVASELGVTHVLEGSVQKSGQRIRINAQFIDAASGHHLWAERFDRDLIDIFALQDEVSKKIVEALSIELTREEQQRLESSRQTDPKAYDLLLRGLEQLRRFTRDTNIEARDYFLQAIDIDPGFARAYADVALSYGLDIQFGWGEITPAKYAVAFEYADKALELDDTLGQVYFAYGMLYLLKKERGKAIEACKRSLISNPNYADCYAQYAQALSYDGKPEEALEKLHKAMEINPRYSFFYSWIEGRIQQLLGNSDRAEMLFLDVIERNAHFPGAHLTLAALYGNQGRIEDAQWEATEVLSLRPDFSLRKEAENAPYKNQADLDQYINGLRKAGLPE